MKKVSLQVVFLLALCVVGLVGWSHGEVKFNGPDDAVLLQGFHWESHNYDWYKIIDQNAEVIRDAGFDFVWFPPPAKTTDSAGYLPTQWYDLDSRYGRKEELIKAIQSLKGDVAGQEVYAIADLVLNHRCGRYNWADFHDPHFGPEDETDADKISKANNKAVCINDEWVGQSGVSEQDRTASFGGDDTGDSFDGGRDLDHANEHVQREIKQWLEWLKDDIGFAGWRWDLVKGYHPKYVGMYNDASEPMISIGEYWDDQDRQQVVDWVNRTTGKPDTSWGVPDRSGGKSAAFDFPTRDLIRKAVMHSDYQCLKTIGGKPAGVIGWWPGVSVTFIENHDTETAHRPYMAFPGDRIMQGYAYILTHPGKPCVFWKHYFDWSEDKKQKIKKLITIRKEAGLHAESVVHIHKAEKGLYAAVIDDKLAMKIGDKGWEPSGQGWILQTHGNNYAVWRKQP